MPELPEVETTRRGLEPHLIDNRISRIIIRENRLRWPIPSQLRKCLPGQPILQVARRGKYLLFGLPVGTLILHLGMSGSLKLVTAKQPATKHDHVDLLLEDARCLRFTDPRRFGCLLWTAEDPTKHNLLKHLGPEPLTKQFSAYYLYELSRKRSIAIKSLIMNSQVVVGVGNIYAAESLFYAGIHPTHPASQLTLQHYQVLVSAIKKVLRAAIKRGGTTLRNFVASDGNPGYFQQKLAVYGRANAPCLRCQAPLQQLRLGQRSTVYCIHCQTPF